MILLLLQFVFVCLWFLMWRWYFFNLAPVSPAVGTLGGLCFVIVEFLRYLHHLYFRHFLLIASFTDDLHETTKIFFFLRKKTKQNKTKKKKKQQQTNKQKKKKKKKKKKKHKKSISNVVEFLIRPLGCGGRSKFHLIRRQYTYIKSKGMEN